MKAKEVLKILNISRVTLWKYVRDGKIKVVEKENGQYDYDEKSICELMNCELNKHIAIYARVSTNEQKNDLKTQINELEKYVKKEGINEYKIYSEVGSGIKLERNEFKNLLDNILNKKVSKLYITNRDRLTRLSFITMEEIFNKLGTEIIIINEEGQNKNENEEIMEELMSMMYYFSTKMYSNRRKIKTSKK